MRRGRGPTGPRPRFSSARFLSPASDDYITKPLLTRAFAPLPRAPVKERVVQLRAAFGHKRWRTDTLSPALEQSHENSVERNHISTKEVRSHRVPDRHAHVHGRLPLGPHQRPRRLRVRADRKLRSPHLRAFHGLRWRHPLFIGHRRRHRGPRSSRDAQLREPRHPARDHHPGRQLEHPGHHVLRDRSQRVQHPEANPHRL